MSRLIDAERFKRFLQALCKAGAPYDEVIQLLDKEPTVYEIDIVKKGLKELKQYRAIGTIEEFKALKEKNVAKKPIYSDFDDNGDDEIIPYKAICPVCGNEFEFGYWNDEYNHHCVCGQKIDW